MTQNEISKLLKRNAEGWKRWKRGIRGYGKFERDAEKPPPYVLVGETFLKINFSSLGLKHIVFVFCRFKDCKFILNNFERTVFITCQIENCSFSGCDLSGCLTLDTRFENVTFRVGNTGKIKSAFLPEDAGLNYAEHIEQIFFPRKENEEKHKSDET